jgi:hypothetical protein
MQPTFWTHPAHCRSNAPPFSCNGMPYFVCPQMNCQSMPIQRHVQRQVIEFKVFLSPPKGTESEFIQKIVESPLLQHYKSPNSHFARQPVNQSEALSRRLVLNGMQMGNAVSGGMSFSDCREENKNEINHHQVRTQEFSQEWSPVAHQNSGQLLTPEYQPDPQQIKLQEYISPQPTFSKSIESTDESKNPQHLSLGMIPSVCDTDDLQALEDRAIPLRNLKSVFLVLQKFFRGKNLTVHDISFLASYELDILNYIVKRKFETTLFTTEAEKSNREGIFVRLEKCQGILSAKRAEESFKFLFTRTIKNLKKAFANRNRGQDSHSNQAASFCNYYFGEAAPSLQSIMERLGQSIGDTTKQFRYSNLNLSHFRALIKCDQFRKDMNLYFQTELAYDHQIEIDRKILHILDKWDCKLNSLKHEKDSVAYKKLTSDIARYFLQNKRCKLPWTSGEVSNAIQRINALAEKVISHDTYSCGLE